MTLKKNNINCFILKCNRMHLAVFSPKVDLRQNQLLLYRQVDMLYNLNRSKTNIRQKVY